MDNNSTINTRTNEIRLSFDYSKKDFAKEINTPYQTVNNVLSGKNFPGYATIMKIYERFEIDLNWLMTGEGEMNNKGNKTSDNFKYTKLLEEQKVLYETQIKKNNPDLAKDLGIE